MDLQHRGVVVVNVYVLSSTLTLCVTVRFVCSLFLYCRTRGMDRAVWGDVCVGEAPRGGLTQNDHGEGQREGGPVRPWQCVHDGFLQTVPLHPGLLLQLYRGTDGHGESSSDCP